jgi:CheY-like chemotaxis protein
MPNGGTLELAVRRVDDEWGFERGIRGPAVLLTVTDTGTGMDVDTLSRAFEPFFTTKPVGQGTGLGLATVYGIVRQSNGAIWAESEAGAGTRVSVLFPRVEATPEPAAVLPVVVPAKGAEATILVVEDDPAVRAFVVATLEHAGYRLMVAGSPAQAVALTDGLDEGIDLLLTDLVMPGGNGRNLADRLLAGRPSLRVVLMSGYDATLADGSFDGRFRFLAKPFGADELITAVRQVLAGEATTEA